MLRAARGGGSSGSCPSVDDHASLVRPGDRDERRPAVHRRDGAAAVRGDRILRQRHDVRHARRDDGARRARSASRIRGASCSTSAARRSRGGLWDYLTENKDYPYYLIRDRFAGAEGRSLRALPRGTGKILVTRRRARGRVPRPGRLGDDEVVERLHAHGMSGAVERRGAHVGLPVSRLAVLAKGKGARRPRGRTARTPQVIT